MANRDYNPETKAAIMAALLAGQSVSSIAKEYEIPKGTVSNWKREAYRELEPEVQSERTQKKARIGELLLEYLEANLKALKAQAEQFADARWLSKQQADEAAVLHGVMTDKAIRLLEAFGANDTDSNTAD